MTIGQRIEWFFRHAVTYPILRTLFRNKNRPEQIDLGSIRSILILRYDRFGDMIVTSPIVQHLRKMNPPLTIGLAASAGNTAIAEHIPGVDHVHVVSGTPGRILSSILKARRVQYDVVLNFIFNRTSTGGILANLIAPSGVKVGQGDTKYAFYFNRMVSLDRGRSHMVNILDDYCSEVFGSSWGSADLRYALTSEPNSDARVSVALEGFRKQLNKKTDDCIVVNISAGEERRNPSPDQMTYVARYLANRYKSPIVMVGAPDSYDLVRSIQRDVGSPRLFVYPPSGTAPFMDMVSLIRRAKYLVSPDTSLVHLACSVKTPVVALYASAREYAEWSPVGIPSEVCFDPTSGVVSTIPPARIIASCELLEERLKAANTR